MEALVPLCAACPGLCGLQGTPQKAGAPPTPPTPEGSIVSNPPCSWPAVWCWVTGQVRGHLSLSQTLSKGSLLALRCHIPPGTLAQHLGKHCTPHRHSSQKLSSADLGAPLPAPTPSPTTEDKLRLCAPPQPWGQAGVRAPELKALSRQ